MNARAGQLLRKWFSPCSNAASFCAAAALVALASVSFASGASASPILNLFVNASPGLAISCGPGCPLEGIQSGGSDTRASVDRFALASARPGAPGSATFYGVFASASATASPVTIFGAGALAEATAEWLDFITPNAPGVPAGTAGLLTIILLIEGSQSDRVVNPSNGPGFATNSSSALHLAIDYGLSHFNGFRQFENGQLLVDDIHPNSPFVFVSQVILGQPNSVRLRTDADARGNAAFPSGGSPGSTFGSVDFSNTISWGGIQGLTLLDGTPVTDFTIESTSGFDYTASHLVESPAPSIPEPPAVVLLLVGLAAIGLRRHAHRNRARTGH